MDAPTEWTYGGQLDWSSPESLKLAPAGMCVRCIIEALKERAKAVNRYSSLDTLLKNDYNPFQTLKVYIDAIQSGVTSTILYKTQYVDFWLFCNHTDNSGNWHNTDIDFFPRWTETDILNEIDAESRLSLGRFSPFLSEWFFQQYKILNTLRWVAVDNISQQLVTQADEYKSWYGNGETEAEAVSDWHIQSSGVGDPENCRYTLQDSSNYSAFLNQSKWKIGDLTIGTYPTVNYDFSVDVDWYVRDYGNFHEFEDWGDSVIEKKLCKFKSENFPATTPVKMTTFFPENTDCPDRWYGTSGTVGWKAPSLAKVTQGAILKFDGTNGFKFKNW